MLWLSEAKIYTNIHWYEPRLALKCFDNNVKLLSVTVCHSNRCKIPNKNQRKPLIIKKKTVPKQRPEHACCRPTAYATILEYVAEYTRLTRPHYLIYLQYLVDLGTRRCLNTKSLAKNTQLGALYSLQEFEGDPNKFPMFCPKKGRCDNQNFVWTIRNVVWLKC